MEREKQKKRKADEKRMRRLERKSGQTEEASVSIDEEANEADGLEETQDGQSTAKNEIGDDSGIADD